MLTVRDAVLEDAERIVEIYDYYVKHTAITFEYETPSVEELQERMKKTWKRYPYLVIEKDGCVEGYAYAGDFISRAAADWDCEVTIYLHKDAHKCGMGRILYEALEDALKKMGILNLYAYISYPEKNDEYLTTNSADFHKHLGFEKIGEAHKCCYKFGRWYHMIWAEKFIGKHEKQPAVVTPYADCLKKK